ncbi:MAG: dTDP-4-amino-4,6-dideoxygalactose transaminase [Acidimicrobiales bacterium]|nr:dTDP-4-amino-4,6-dideoxygalactose transaminase [Acidimicrobiales bacterium]
MEIQHTIGATQSARTGTHDKVPFNRPSIEGAELTYLRQAVEGGHSSAKGPFARRVAELLREHIGASDVLLTTSCTAALELAGMLLDLQPGDTVIVPSFTFVTTALAFAREGARLVFADIEPETLGLDPSHVAELLDDRVRAVVPVHYAGIGCQMDELLRVVEGYDRVSLIEDNAHGLFGSYRGKPLGAFGRFSTLSFHETKNFVCGEGGALVLNHGGDVERAHVLFDKGTNRRAFLNGQVDKYTWTDTGSSFGMADLLAAYLLGQLEARDTILAKRRAVFERYRSNLEPHAGADFEIMRVPQGRGPAYHMFYVLLPDRELRDRALRGLNQEGILATFHYVPLHAAPKAQAFMATPTACPVTEAISGRLLRLPFFNGIEADVIDRVCDTFLGCTRA